jgi:hypothetical protein
MMAGLSKPRSITSGPVDGGSWDAAAGRTAAPTVVVVETPDFAGSRFDLRVDRDPSGA